jgi:hypothetical protein
MAESQSGAGARSGRRGKRAGRSSKREGSQVTGAQRGRSGNPPAEGGLAVEEFEEEEEFDEGYAEEEDDFRDERDEERF